MIVRGECSVQHVTFNFGKISTAVRRANKKPEPDGFWFAFSSREWIRTTDLRVKSKNPESVLFVRQVLQTLALPARASVSQTGERWSLLARHAAVVDRGSYSSFFTWVRQVFFEFF